MSKIITDENQLNTEIEDLITEDYALEILGLKNPADFRKFSRSFMKLSKIVKKISDETDTKFKNYCPISVGSIDVRYDNKNPAELYPSTTWELIPQDKYIRTGATPLSTGGSNSVRIVRENLPSVKLKVDSFSVTTQPHSHTIEGRVGHGTTEWDKVCTSADNTYNQGRTNVGGGENTGTASPSTEALGSGTALTIQPEYITLRFWKRLT